MGENPGNLVKADGFAVYLFCANSQSLQMQVFTEVVEALLELWCRCQEIRAHLETMMCCGIYQGHWDYS